MNRFIRSLEWKAMRDDGSGVELSGAEEACHLEPRVIHPTAHDAVDRQPFEDDLGREVDIHRLGWNTQHLHSSADAHERERLMDRRWHARHLQNDVDTQTLGVTLDHLFGL